MSVHLNGQQLSSRLDRIFTNWQDGYDDENSPWHKIDAINLYSGKTDPNANEQKTCAFQLWLLGFEFPDTIMVFVLAGRKILFLTGSKKASHLEEVKSDKMTILLTSKEDQNKKNFQQLVSSIKEGASGGPQSAKMGIVLKEQHSGAQAESWEKFFKTEFTEKTMPLGPALSAIMVVKDSEEMKLITKSGEITDSFFKILKENVESVIESEEKKSHATLDNELRDLLEDEKTMAKLSKQHGVDPKDVDIAYSVIQSGGKYDLKMSAHPTNENLCTGEGVIVIGIGAKYKEYATNVVRTLIVCPKEEISHMYHTVMAICKVIVTNLKPGTAFNDVYTKARKVIEEKCSKHEEKFTKRLGHSIGLELQEPLYSLTKNCDKIVLEGMVINVSVGVSNMETKSKKQFAIWLADTFQVRDGEQPCQALTHSERKLDQVTYELEEEEDDSSKENKDERAKNKEAAKVSTSVLNDRNVMFSARLRSERGESAVTQKAFKDFKSKQQDLRRHKQDKVLARFTGDGDDGRTELKKAEIKKLSSVAAYMDVGYLPKEMKPNKIHVDGKNEAILLPISGTLVPFHVSTIKNVSQPPSEGTKNFMRINFYTPGSGGFNKASDPLPLLTSPNSLFIKEVSVKTEDSKHIQSVFRQIKELIKKVKVADEEAAQKKDLVEQATIQYNKTKTRAILKDLSIRPSFGQKRFTGTLEAHTNGFRFQSSGRSTEVVDIVYKNIQHAIFQDAQNELMIVLHFHLKNPIMVGKRKLTDVQFYTEAGAQADDLDARRRRAYQDPDEIAEEQREREMRNRLNREFKRFCEASQEIASANRYTLEFDVPYKQLGFPGVPSGCRANLQECVIIYFFNILPDISM
eukprot:GHVL01034251.1.p1 GENE.GHVL01034251.1~~GHVL01034251.1.p1  ORF type:complete len:859 (+),score=117.86 GHVL01034251.1:78-2654(+)